MQVNCGINRICRPRRISLSWLSAALAIIAASLLAQGCCGGAAVLLGSQLIDDERSKQTMEGLVTLGGVAVDGAQVLLTPEPFPANPDANKVYLDVADSNGNYKLSFRWDRYRHYTLTAIYTDDQGTAGDTADDQIYTGSMELKQLVYEPVKQNIELNLQNAVPAASFSVAGIVMKADPDGPGLQSAVPAEGALLTIQPSFAAGEAVEVFTALSAADGSFTITLPWFDAQRRYLLTAVYPANGLAGAEGLQSHSTWLGPYAVAPDGVKKLDQVQLTQIEPVADEN